jgi:hypothetical protein
MNDLVMALQMSLLAQYGPPPKPKPLEPIAQELLDYVNSPEYRQLEINEWLTANPRR